MRARILLLFLVSIASAVAWVPQPGNPWPDGTVVIVPDLVRTAPVSSTNDWDGVARQAIAGWNAVLDRVKLTAVAPSEPAWYENYRNEMFFDTKMYGRSMGNGVLAVTLISTDDEDRVDADIVFNRNIQWGLYDGPLTSVPDFRRVAIHEIGHVLGLSHPDEAKPAQTVTALMNSHLSDIDQLVADDIQGIRALYGPAFSPPVIVEGPSVTPSTVIAGNPVKLSVRAGGRGPLTYAWHLDGVPVKGGTAPTVGTDAVTAVLAGTFTVVVSNEAGAVTSSPVQLTVIAAKPPQTVDAVVDPVRIHVGSDYTLGAAGVTAGDAPMHYEWRCNGAVIGTTTNDPTYILKNVQFSDTGTYTVTAKNVAGTVEGKKLDVTVIPGSPPSFPDAVAPVYLKVGDSSMSISIPASGSGMLTYQWRKGGVDVPGATASSLKFPVFNLHDAGTYSLVASNALGSAVSPDLLVSPVFMSSDAFLFSTHPAAITEFEGAPVRFSVQIPQNATYRWYKDGVAITNPVLIPPLSSPTAALDLGYVRQADSGVYSVEISQLGRAVMSRGARLTVLPPHLVINTQPSPHTVAVGGLVSLSVKLDRPFADPAITSSHLIYEWFKDGAFFAKTEGPLEFTARMSDSGRYFVKVSNHTGASVDSDTVDVIVNDGPAPIILAHPPSIVSSDAENVDAVSLEIMMRRAARTAQSHQLQLITASGPAVGGFIPGLYQMVATRDGVSQTSRPFRVEFRPPLPPVIYKHPASRSASLGSTIYLSANAPAAISNIRWQWYKDGTAIPGATTSELRIENITETSFGNHHVTATNPSGTISSEIATVEKPAGGLAGILVHPLPQTAIEGARVTFSATGAGEVRSYQWQKNGASIPGATLQTLELPSVTSADAGNYSVTIVSTTNSVTSAPALLRVLAAQRAPQILMPPVSQSVRVGNDATFFVGATGAPLPDRYQWRRNGIDIPGATNAELRLRNVQTGDAGVYTAVAFNSNGTATSVPAALEVDGTARLVNLATRARVGRGENVLISGFVITGEKPCSVLVRGVGAQLRDFGVGWVLRNPVLRIFDSASREIASSDDWSEGTDAESKARVQALRDAENSVGAFALATGSKDSALIATLQPGSYTAQVSGYIGTAGVALVEVYELGKPLSTRLVNLSCRSFVGTGGEVVIPGLTVSGATSRKLLVRAVGPTLKNMGVDGALLNPRLTLYRGNTVLAENDNWGDDPDTAARVLRAGGSVGAFPLAAGSKDAALLLELEPGSYTLHVAGVGDTTGVALVEVYEVP